MVTFSFEVDPKGNQMVKSNKTKMVKAVRSAVSKIAERRIVKRGRGVKNAKLAGVKPSVGKASSSVFGPVTTIDTAPVAIGNTYTGSKPVVVPTLDGVRIRGRDYLLGIDSTAAAITGWTLVGAAPLTPACMVTSTLKHFANSYSEYAVHGLAFHYITTASTAETGSVMFYVNKDRVGPGLVTSSANFMPLVLSDHNTLIGPLWQNSTAVYIPEPEWMPTDVTLSEDLRHQAVGELMVFTRTSVTDSPGYVLIDYDITFRNMQVNPRSLYLPISRMKYTQVLCTISSAAYTQGNAAFFAVVGGTLLDGVSTSALPSGTVVGDVFKVIMNVSNANFTTATTANIFQSNLIGANGVAATITDGFTAYAIYSSTGHFYLSATYVSSMADNANIGWGVTATFAATIPAYMSYVGSFNELGLQANF